MTQRFTVAMMIEALSKLPPDAPLFVSGYEGGYDDAEAPSGPATLALDVAGGVYGRHFVPGRFGSRGDGECATGYLIGPDNSGEGGAFDPDDGE